MIVGCNHFNYLLHFVPKTNIVLPKGGDGSRHAPLNLKSLLMEYRSSVSASFFVSSNVIVSSSSSYVDRRLPLMSLNHSLLFWEVLDIVIVALVVFVDCM